MLYKNVSVKVEVKVWQDSNASPDLFGNTKNGFSRLDYSQYLCLDIL